jgi:hypothetical protein
MLYARELTRSGSRFTNGLLVSCASRATSAILVCHSLAPKECTRTALFQLVKIAVYECWLARVVTMSLNIGFCIVLLMMMCSKCRFQQGEQDKAGQLHHQPSEMY